MEFTKLKIIPADSGVDRWIDAYDCARFETAGGSAANSFSCTLYFLRGSFINW
jgi:hypothetical protein